MLRSLFLFVLAAAFFLPRLASAQDDATIQNDGPPIAITSPDQASTFVFGEIKDHALVWNKARKELFVSVTFTDADQNFGQANEDTHVFWLPGVRLDAAKGVFVATSANGEDIPVAHYKKTLFIQWIEVLPNACVRILHPKGKVTVILEAISPNDPSLHPGPANSDSDGTHQVDIDKIVH
ncbi:MAG: hypothetical protein LV480_06130 [Methylacidiphilales bacterium]|nr:hypothetical protein [Candidatus Methylacidiphilales bacterium]